jgi:hypothetical protein
MFVCPPCANKILPEKYWAAAEKLFPGGGFPEGKAPTLDAVRGFADILGIDADYKKMWDARSSGKPISGFLNLFQNNLDLLIQKTWVEKADELRKENLQDKVPPFIILIENGDFQGALREFGAILEELAYLFFGAESQKDDFAEYALRIDVKMGLFWWYGGQINSAQDWVKKLDDNLLYALLLLGICYLTDF